MHILSSDGIADRRALAQRAHEERAAEREKDLAAQASPFSTPQERIRLWEGVHALALPSAKGHRLVRVIATQTNLTLAEVQAEQARRAADLAT